MANTYTQLYVHFVFAVKHREALLHADWDERLRSYIIAVIQNHGHKVLAINNMPDHMHILVGLNPVQGVSELMRNLKGDSSEWINKEHFTKRKFHWQEGYGAFSHSRSQIDGVVKYIHNQQEHHRKIGFIEEYKTMLENFAVEYNEHYVFKLPE